MQSKAEKNTEDNKVVVECSPAAKVRFHSDMHRPYVVKAENGLLTHVEFDLNEPWADPYQYIRVIVVDEEGKHAWTNPIFLD